MRYVIVGTLVLGVSGASAYWLGNRQAAPAVTADPGPSGPVIAGLYPTAGTLDFGEAWESDDFVWEVTLRNLDDAERVVTDFETGCNCLRVEPHSLRIPAGETATVRVHLDLTHRAPKDRSPRRPYETEFRPMVEGQSRPKQGWPVRGTIRSRLTADTHFIQFADLDVVAPGGERLPGVALPVAGLVQPERGALPPFVSLGSRPVGETAEASVAVRGPKAATLRFDHAEADSPDVAVEWAAPAVRFRQRVTRPGDQVQEVRLFFTTSAGESVTFRVTLTHFGLSGEAAAERR